MKYFVRHDRTLTTGVCYGWTDLAPAIDPGVTLQQIRDQLPDQGPVFSSPLRRCRLLAESIAGSSDRVSCRDDLREVHFGDWENQPWDQVPRAQLDAWARAPFSYQLPGGESIPGFLERVQHVLQDIPDGAIVVTHGGVIRAARHLMAGDPLPTAFSATVPFASVHLF